MCTIESKKLSVIVPMYNVNDTIRKCINSCYELPENDVEIILVDDGSTDETPKICESFFSDMRIKYFKQKNKGVSAARNLGMSKAVGKYLFFLDADDTVDGNNLYQALLWTLANEIDLTQMSFKTIKKTKNFNNKFDKTYYNGNSDEFTEVLQQIKLNFVWGKFFKKEIIDDRNIQFNLDMKYAEDYDLVLRFILQCRKIAVSKLNGYNYVNKGNGASGKFVRNLDYCNSVINDNLQILYNVYPMFRDSSIPIEIDVLQLYSGISELNNVYKKNSPYNYSKRINFIEQMLQTKLSRKNITGGKYIRGRSNIIILRIVKIRITFIIDLFLYFINYIK